MNPDKIGKFIYELRKEQNLSQYQLADLIPISRQGVSKWERGVTTPDPQTLLKLSELFKVSINELLVGERLENNSIEDLEKTTLSILDQSNKKTKQIKRITATAIAIIALLLLSFLSYYFINSYNTIEVYKVGNTNKNFTIVNGIFMKTNEKYYLKLGKLKNKINAEIKNIKVFYKKDKKNILIIEDQDVDNITVIDSYGYSENLTRKDINNFKDNLYLEITYNEDEKEIIKLRFRRDYNNNSLFFINQKVGKNKEPAKSNNIEYVKIEEPVIEETQPVIEETPKEEKQMNEKRVEEEPKEQVPEPPKEEPITLDMIINKIKETCTLDAGSYICGYDNYSIMLMYYEDTNKITLYKNFNILGDYLLNENDYACIVEGCKTEFEIVIKDNLLP